MFAFWICLFLLHGPNIRNSEVACNLFRPHPGHSMEPGARLCCYGRTELCEEAKCLPAQNILENDRNITLAGVLQIHTGSFTSLPRADIN